jgi:hypothetical protein
MEIGNRQDLFRTCPDPFFPLLDLALGTVPVAATVIGDLSMAAVGTTLEMSPKYGRPAIDNGPDYLSLLVAYFVAFQKIVPILPEYPCHLVLRSQGMW